MKKNGAGYFVLWLVLVCTVLAISGWNKRELPAVTPGVVAASPFTTATPSPQASATAVSVQGEELVGIWIPYMSLETKAGTEASFKENYERMLDKAADMGVNTLFVHVRPFCDALYPSKLFPWSHIVSGTQGQDPGFDPLEYMIQSAHKKNMKFHAWINPLRVKTTQTPAVLAEESPYMKFSETNPYYFLNIKGNVYLNPAYSEVRTLITDGVREIAENYPVDGIHFDDYFYPEQIGEADSEAYDTYCGNTAVPLSLTDWRLANINAMVSQVYREVKSIDVSMPFGISPQGNIGNNKELGADVHSWCSTKGYIDYICPQIYFSYDNPALGFTEALESWLQIETHDQLKLYIGLGLYKAGTDSDEGTWQGENNLIARQIEEVRKTNCNGIVLYDILAVESATASAEVGNAKEELAS